MCSLIFLGAIHQDQQLHTCQLHTLRSSYPFHPAKQRQSKIVSCCSPIKNVCERMLDSIVMQTWMIPKVSRNFVDEKYTVNHHANCEMNVATRGTMVKTMKAGKKHKPNGRTQRTATPRIFLVFSLCASSLS